MRTDVAALYVDPRGPYPKLVADWYDTERNAILYQGPRPVVAHPPCAHWGRLRNLPNVRITTGEAIREAFCALMAVQQVRQWGGVLEHPAESFLWASEKLPRPGQLPDAFGGWTLALDQSRLGHSAQKRTWLYIVGASASDLPPAPPRASRTAKKVELMGKLERRLTPPAFAEWLIEVASKCRVKAVVA